MLRFLESMQWVLFIFFTAAYAYQIFYLLVGLWGKQRGGVENAELHRYAAIISARNESAVIGRLIRTLKEQDYPSELLDVIVVADNCTDNTAEVARSAGAIVYERFIRCRSARATRWIICSSIFLRSRVRMRTMRFSYSMRTTS